MQLTRGQQEQFVEQGYVVVPGVIPRPLIDDALRAINTSLGEGIRREELDSQRARTFCPELAGASVITDLLFESPAFALAESMLGAGNVRRPKGAQIALRFPGPRHVPFTPVHIDGFSVANNGVEPGTVLRFSLLAQMPLSDVTGPESGNFTVWPGTHRLYEAYFREHGPMSLAKGMPPVDLPEPVQLTVNAGDLVLAHYQVGHGFTPNQSPNIRYAVFFRLFHTSHRPDDLSPMTDIWKEYEGLRQSAPTA